MIAKMRRAMPSFARLCAVTAIVVVKAAVALSLSIEPVNAEAAAASMVSVAGASAVPAAAAGPVTDYRLGAGDVLHITVYQNPDLTLDVRVSDSGLISYPLLGALRIGGLTVPETEALIGDGLKKGEFVKNPQVTAVIMQVRGSQVSVLGQVNRPGRYPLEQSQTHLTDVLALAGGTIPGVGSDTVTVVGTRDGKQFRTEVDLPHVFEVNDRSLDMILQGNDVIWVGRAPQVYIYGEVQRPGPFRLERHMTLLQGLAAGGGLTQRGTEKGIRVHRRAADGHIEVLQPGMDADLLDGDVIYVRESLF
jgi:polysaccharide export outer membrane protein